jgi:alginate O-acetyltransferase complex protein AlgI
MLFSSIASVIFFLSLVLVAFALVQRVSYRLSLVLLLAASLFFYDFFYDGYHVPAYIALLLGSIAWNFAFGRHLRAQPSKPLLGLAVAGAGSISS